MKKATIFGLFLVVFGCAAARAITYKWTAPFDNVGVVRYEAHYSLTADSTANLWANCRAINGLPTPSPAGQTDSVTVNVPVGKKYYMCIKAYDAANNVSWCSNIDSTYVPDTDPPQSITDLRAAVR